MRETLPRKTAGNSAVLTCARTSEALTLEWSELDLDERLVGGAGAGDEGIGQEQVVYLSARAPACFAAPTRDARAFEGEGS
jgi:hypothetical protein